VNQKRVATAREIKTSGYRKGNQNEWLPQGKSKTSSYRKGNQKKIKYFNIP
jgi:hypothetical protein